MKKEQWQKDWQGLVRKVCQEPCPEVLGLDLHRGEFLRGQGTLNAFHLQVFGQDIFLRNMMQRTLETDLAQRSRTSPIIVIVPNNRREILDEANKVFAKPTPFGVDTLFFYAPARPKHSLSLEQAMRFLEFGKQTHLFMELEAKYKPLEAPLILHLNNGIKEKFKSEILIYSMSEQPFIYLFCPEDMGSQDHVVEYINRLKEHVSFRIFSTEPSHFFHREKTSSIDGPDLYPKETCEKMRDHSYWQLKQQRKWNKDECFFGDRENPKILRWVKASVANVAINKTAFGRFKSPYGRGCEYFWFYPVFQSLGNLPYTRPSKIPNEGFVSNEPLPPPDPILEIINDLKPKDEDSKKELC